MKEKIMKMLLIGAIICAYKVLYAPDELKKEGKEGGQIQWVEPTRGWDENGTNLWTAVSPLPSYNVGIGTSTPAYKLDVVGNSRIQGDLYINSWPIRVTSAPPVGYVLKWNGSAFVPATDENSGGNVSGSGSPTQVAFWTGTYTISGDNNLWWDNTNKRLGIGTNAPNCNLHVVGKGRVIYTPTTNDTAFVGKTSGTNARRGVYGECFASDGAGVGVTGVGGYFGAAAWYAPSNGYIGGVLGTYWGEGVWGLSDANYYGYTGVLGEGINGAAGVTGNANGLSMYYSGAGVGGFSTDVGTFGYGDATSLSFGVFGVSDATDGIGVYGRSAGAALYSPPSGQDAGLFAAGQYYGLYGMAQRTASHGIGVVGLGYNTTTLTYVNGAGVIGCGNVGVAGCKDQYTYGILGYTTTQANYFYHYEQSLDDQQSAIYAYRTRSAQNQNDGTGYGVYSTNQAIQGYNFWGDNYTFGIAGHSWLDFYRCGGVLGADWSGSNWGSLGYRSSAGQTFGGYFTSTGTGGGLLGIKSGIGFGSYGNLMGGWVRGEEYGLYVKGERYGLYVDGNEYVKGCIATVHEENNNINILYTLTSTSVNVMTFGKAKLSNGKAKIDFDDNFRKVVSDKEPIIVIVTPIGECGQIYVSDVSKNGFSANTKERTNNEFYYVAIGKRKGYENINIPQELLAPDFDDNMLEVAFNENNLNGKAKGIYYDGSTLRFGEPPSTPVAKPSEPENIAKVVELQKLTKKLENLKKEIRRIEKGIERSIKDVEKSGITNKENK
ncbi:MAG: hypothetical protein ABIM36_03180 [candidate division WOR-3 bacterium]